tara:strand:+ start:5726 stop:6781 length:1056 start_codon:yes stop_codon:yes gene_type:complete
MFTTIQLKSDFNNVKHMREYGNNLLDALDNKIKLLNDIYTNLLDKNKDESDTGLDSFYFQKKLIAIEFKNSFDTFKIIENRIYCDYYKLYKTMIKYLYETIKNKNTTCIFNNKKYPIYNDLDILSLYDFNFTIELHNDIIQIIDILIDELTSRDHKLCVQKTKKQNGLEIDNLINNINHNNNKLKNHLVLFIDYLNVYNKFHSKYLTRFFIKIKLFYGQINNDIFFEEIKTDMNCETDICSNIFLEKEEEEIIRKFVPEDNLFTDDITKTDTKNNIMFELNNMISGVNISPNTSYSNQTDTDNNLENNEYIDNDDNDDDNNDDNNESYSYKIEINENDLEYGTLNNYCIIL